jgi:hypothetical protein
MKLCLAYKTVVSSVMPTENAPKCICACGYGKLWPQGTERDYSPCLQVFLGQIYLLVKQQQLLSITCTVSVFSITTTGYCWTWIARNPRRA